MFTLGVNIGSASFSLLIITYAYLLAHQIFHDRSLSYRASATGYVKKVFAGYSCATSPAATQ